MEAVVSAEPTAASPSRRMAYADPPYPGQAKRHYKNATDCEGVTWAGDEVDHPALIERLLTEYPDGWALSTSSTALREVWNLCPDARVAVWTKGFAAFKNQRITFAWEPVLYMARGGVAEDVGVFVRDWVSAMPPVFVGERTMIRGQKPELFCFWLFDLLGLGPDDVLDDLFPGSGAVMEAWERWRRQPRIRGLVA
jgi:hypothetical protein